MMQYLYMSGLHLPRPYFPAFRDIDFGQISLSRLRLSQYEFPIQSATLESTGVRWGERSECTKIVCQIILEVAAARGIEGATADSKINVLQYHPIVQLGVSTITNMSAI